MKCVFMSCRTFYNELLPWKILIRLVIDCSFIFTKNVALEIGYRRWTFCITRIRCFWSQQRLPPCCVFSFILSQHFRFIKFATTQFYNMHEITFSRSIKISFCLFFCFVLFCLCRIYNSFSGQFRSQLVFLLEPFRWRKTQSITISYTFKSAIIFLVLLLVLKKCDRHTWSTQFIIDTLFQITISLHVCLLRCSIFTCELCEAARGSLNWHGKKRIFVEYGEVHIYFYTYPLQCCINVIRDMPVTSLTSPC